MRKTQLNQEKLSDFHGSNRGSNPRGDANNQNNNLSEFPVKTGDLLYPACSRIFPRHPESSESKSKPTGEKVVGFKKRPSKRSPHSVKNTPQWKAAHSRKQCILIRQRREEWLQANGPCRQCGSWKRLEVDHIDPSEKVSHRIWSWTKEKRDAELQKCQPLCHRCHLAKTVAFNRSRRKGKPGRALKLTEQQVIKILGMIEIGMPLRRIAAIVGVNHTTISGIKTGKYWSWLTSSVRKEAA